MKTTSLIGQCLHLLSIASPNKCFRDLSALNILFDERGQMYPRGFHPLLQVAEADFSRPANPNRRREAKDIKYIFIDFGISSRFNSLEERYLVYGCMAQDPTIPELSGIVPYNPFAIDVYTLGNVYREELLEVHIYRLSLKQV